VDSAARTISTNDTTVAATVAELVVLVDALNEVAAAGATDNAVPVLGVTSTDMQTVPTASQTTDDLAAVASPNKVSTVTATSSSSGQ
jgi:indole-3-glycerol phosphate synthase